MLRKGDIISGKYKVLKKIGRGGFGTVYLAQKIGFEDEEYALKVLEGLKVTEELKIGLELGRKSPYLVKFEEVLVRKEEDEEGIIIIQEYCSGGDLEKKIREGQLPSDGEIYRFVYESSMAVKKLHDAKIIHRDINPRNFFIIRNGGTKLGDYGLARTLESASSKSWTRAGADGYIPPEILLGKPYSMKVDIFALGATYLEFITGQSPFMKPGEPLRMDAFLQGTLVGPAATHGHPVATLARRMVSANPDHRPVIEDVLAFPQPLSAFGPVLSCALSASASASASTSSSTTAAAAAATTHTINTAAALAERDAAVGEKEAMKRERDAAVRERDAAVRERDAAVREKEAAVERERATQIKPVPVPAPAPPLDDFGWLDQNKCPKCHREITWVNEKDTGKKNCRKCGREFSHELKKKKEKSVDTSTSTTTKEKKKDTSDTSNAD